MKKEKAEQDAKNDIKKKQKAEEELKEREADAKKEVEKIKKNKADEKAKRVEESKEELKKFDKNIEKAGTDEATLEDAAKAVVAIDGKKDAGMKLDATLAAEEKKLENAMAMAKKASADKQAAACSLAQCAALENHPSIDLYK